MPDLTPEGLRARAREIVAVEPDGTSWRVVLVCGVQRSSVIRLSEREACEAYAAWIQDQILVPAFTALVAEARREQREEDAQLTESIGENAWAAAAHDISLGYKRGVFIEFSQRISAAIRAQEEMP